MSNTEKLLVVQDIDVQIHALQRELQDVPARKQEEERRLASNEAAVAAAEGKLKDLQVHMKELEVEIASRHEKVNKLRQQQFELKTNKEFKAMESEILAVQRDISGIEDRELAMMEQADTVRGELREAQAELQQARAAVDRDIQALDERMADVKQRYDALRGRREEAVREIDAEWLDRYERVHSRRELALAKLEHGVCGGCHMKLPPSAVHDTQKTDVMVSCDFCGRLLY